MDYYYVSMQSENIPNIQQVPMDYTEYHPTRNQQQPQHTVMYPQASRSVLPTFPVIISHQILQQASPPESPRSLCSSSDESHQKPNGGAMAKKKRTRTAFNTFQVMELEREYRQSMYMQSNRRQEVAQRLSLDEKHIKIWFQNRRMRYKREGKLSQKLKTQESVESANIQSNESNDHQHIVKRFRSYSQDTLTQQSAAASIELHQSQLQQNILPPSPPPTESAELTEILDLLADDSTTAISTSSQSSEFLTHSNFTEILEYLKEPITANSKLAPATDQSDEILEYLTASIAPTMPLKEDSELSEILNYLEETVPTSKQMKSPAHSPLAVDEASLKKIRNELELSAEAWRERSMLETTIPTSILVSEHGAQSTESTILNIN